MSYSQPQRVLVLTNYLDPLVSQRCSGNYFLKGFFVAYLFYGLISCSRFPDNSFLELFARNEPAEQQEEKLDWDGRAEEGRVGWLLKTEATNKMFFRVKYSYAMHTREDWRIGSIDPFRLLHVRTKCRIKFRTKKNNADTIRLGTREVKLTSRTSYYYYNA